MLTVVFTDGKVGRHTGVKPLDLKTKKLEPKTADVAATEIYRYIRGARLVASKELLVNINHDCTGDIYVGGRHVGTFTVVEMADGTA